MQPESEGNKLRAGKLQTREHQSESVSGPAKHKVWENIWKPGAGGQFYKEYHVKTKGTYWGFAMKLQSTSGN